MKNKFYAVFVAMMLAICMSITAFAQVGTWKFNGQTWKYYDNVSGGVYHNTFTDDGYWVDAAGDWIPSSIPRDVVSARSANGRVIAVSKSGHVVELWQNGSLVRAYNCSSGKANGDKERQGDCKTPVGEFYVCLMNNNSAYTKGIGVSYPMTEDAERGLKAGLITQSQYDSIVSAVSRKAMPNWYTNLGGEIEIHGGSNIVGSNASRGCIVLTNADILDLYSRVTYGDTVLIYE